jgi:hypothetical protein
VQGCVTAVAAQARAQSELVWVDEDWLVGQGVVQWTQIPLWRNAAAPWGVDTSGAAAAGLVCRPLANTVTDTWAWLRARQPARLFPRTSRPPRVAAVADVLESQRR